MNKIKRIFSHDKESWIKTRKKGFRRYILSIGVLKTGLIGGTICLSFYYFNYLNFKLMNFQWNDYLFNYLIWLPLFCLLGIILAGFTWIENNNKFNK